MPFSARLGRNNSVYFVLLVFLRPFLRKATVYLFDLEMFTMKKILTVILAIVVSAAAIMLAFSGCSSTGNTDKTTAESSTENDEKLSIVTTIFPEYDWVREILGDNADKAELTMLLDSGVDLHSYQPTADDILKISGCDMFIYVGGHSDEWVDDALKQATNKNMITINLCEILGDTVKQEEQIEGMENSHENEHANESSSDSEDHHHNDEHVWLSLKNAKTICLYISDKLCELDADNAETYKSNASAYIAKLDALDKEYQSTVDTAPNDTLIFADRFPFRYMVDDYGLNYYAAFTGCSAESEASFETVKFLANKVDELGLDTVLTIENPSHKIAETVVENTKNKNQEILAMDSMQSTTSGDVENGATYLSVMQKNLEVLKKALA